MPTSMEGGVDSGNDNSLGDSFLANQQFPVEAGDVEEGLGSGDGDEEVGNSEPLREQDRFLPIANVARIMKKSVPTTGKIAKDAKECVQECVSEFISFITSEASERCHQEKRKTINGEDILFAMSTLGFDNYVEPLKSYLQKYRESAKSDKSSGGTGGQETTLEELTENAFENTILSDGQNNVIYTTTYTQGVQGIPQSFNLA